MLRSQLFRPQKAKINTSTSCHHSSTTGQLPSWASIPPCWTQRCDWSYRNKGRRYRWWNLAKPIIRCPLPLPVVYNSLTLMYLKMVPRNPSFLLWVWFLKTEAWMIFKIFFINIHSLLCILFPKKKIYRKISSEKSLRRPGFLWT